MPRHEEQKKNFFIKKILTMLFDFARVDYAEKKLMLGTRVVVEKENFFSNSVPKEVTPLRSKNHQFSHGPKRTIESKIFRIVVVAGNKIKSLLFKYRSLNEKKITEFTESRLTFKFLFSKILSESLKTRYIEA